MHMCVRAAAVPRFFAQHGRSSPNKRSEFVSRTEDVLTTLTRGVSYSYFAFGFAHRLIKLQSKQGNASQSLELTFLHSWIPWFDLGSYFS